MRMAAAVVVLMGACASNTPEAPADASAQLPSLTRAQLLDPAQCKSCHPKHYREWQSSMHAYAAEDPVFLAMNRRGQRETNGELGDFCVRCHAPMAVREGATTDGLNLSELPAELKGVTCYFCHNATGVEQSFNNHLTLADDTTMRGGIADPLPTRAHGAAYSGHHDRNRAESSSLCGSCHDVVTPHGVQLERTFLEYKESLFAKPGPGFETCSGCHMPGRPGRAAEGVDVNSKPRTVHEHLWPGVDVALSDFPDREAQRLAVECALGLNSRIYSMSLSPLGQLSIKVETSAGHNQPSGTAQDRRLWLEVMAFDKADTVLFESGTIEDGELEEKAPGEPGYDPHLVLYRDWMYDQNGQLAHMFWEAAPSADYPRGYATQLLPAALELGSAHTLEARYQLLDALRVERIQVRMRMRPIGLDVLRELVKSGDLDQAVLAEMPTFTLHGAAVEWRPEDGIMQPLWPDSLSCPNDYRCLLEPEASGCK